MACEEPPVLTSRDIARLAGVSQMTVSRVLRNSPNVREETRDRVLSALEGTGYVPNQQARAMRTGRTGTVGVVTGRITNPFYPELIDALGTVLTRRNLQMVLWASDADSGETAAVEAMQGGLIDCVIFTSATEGSASLAAAMRLNLPVVLVVGSIESASCDLVTSDNCAGGALAAAHFMAAGRTDFAVIGGNNSVSTGHERRAGFLDHLRDHGIDVPPEHILDSEFSHDSARAVALTVLAKPNGPRSIFCTNDVVAFGVLDAARKLGLAVPDDVWVIGYDDIQMASWDVFDLTTLTQPVNAIADLGVDLVLLRLDDRERPFEHRRFTPELMVRGTAPHSS
ncbi:LacI family DNA-binding transcriptional regulator [[Micrococcus luteus] ATCC 49442]|uniref:LacI family DNA-binding transcriptional regulator n=1 Tax=[Micrococcus luteus] ATCC 49442 TaxID=2698727 RepID=UPI0013DBD115|nr:LacI family DNA-binding transcriptional regulator [[Micrococcus luteus] ATCC 49442]